MSDYGSTDRVRRYAAAYYIQPARQRGESVVDIHSGVLAKLLQEQHLLSKGRFSLVCNALSSRRFRAENHLSLMSTETSAASGRSSTVTFRFRLEPAETGTESVPDAYSLLRGIAKSSYEELGGAELFHSAEREQWNP